MRCHPDVRPSRVCRLGRRHGRHRKPDGKRAAMPLALTVSDDRPAMGIYHFTHEGQSKAEPRRRLPVVTVGLLESIEHVRKKLSLDALSRVPDLNANFAVL